jgi:hypothetical protein
VTVTDWQQQRPLHVAAVAAVAPAGPGSAAAPERASCLEGPPAVVGEGRASARVLPR